VIAQRVLRDTRAQPEVTFYVGTTPTNADGAVTVDIFRGDGSIFATDAATTTPGTGRYVYTLAPQSNLERFQIVWEGTFGSVVQRQTSFVEVVGAYYVALADIRALQGLSDVAAFPNAKLAESRQWFEDKAESHCGVAFVPRYARDVLNGKGSSRLKLRHNRPTRIISAKFDGAVQTTTDWDLYEDDGSDGFIIASSAFPSGYRNIEIIYEHGFDGPDMDMRQAAFTAIRDNALGLASGIPPQATEVRQEFTTISLSTPGPNAPTGIPSVDQVLNAQRVPLSD
jgi:hypothetical protein